MQLTVENAMNASRHQVHGKRTEGKAGVVLHVGGMPEASVTRSLGRLSWMAGQSERDGGSRLEVPRLASFAGAKRTQLAVLTEAEVMAGLRRVVTGVTCLAAVRPLSPRLTAAPIVLARDAGFSVVPHPVADGWVDEGGIYSW